jgi:hypothetical protein
MCVCGVDAQLGRLARFTIVDVFVLSSVFTQLPPRLHPSQKQAWRT